MPHHQLPDIFLAVLKQDKEATNITVDLSKCGTSYCPAPATCDDTEVDENFKVDRSDLHKIAGAYLACSFVAALIVAVLVDPLSRYFYFFLLAPSSSSCNCACLYCSLHIDVLLCPAVYTLISSVIAPQMRV